MQKSKRHSYPEIVVGLSQQEILIRLMSQSEVLRNIQRKRKMSPKWAIKFIQDLQGLLFPMF
ncbi:CLUMA_CG003357, isoform A [Clunio marinus]|uniref:CLUMA_CG003357, isoform A n=1 Tax=Clunio marinus TaxID=568069 RepID=A0A1J1HN96_9DIPT|nr:CLUMA_CG003357, isoform A [Clunio marinus]